MDLQNDLNRLKIKELIYMRNPDKKIILGNKYKVEIKSMKVLKQVEEKFYISNIEYDYIYEHNNGMYYILHSNSINNNEANIIIVDTMLNNFYNDD